MTNRLQGRVAVVTGGTGGIGQAIAGRLAEEGADVAVTTHDDIGEETRALVEKAGRRFLAVACDVSRPDQVAAFAHRVGEELGRVDIVVNNAGVFPHYSFDELPYEVWKQAFAVNVDSQFLMAKAFVPGMTDAGAGRIINLTTAGIYTGGPNFLQYISSKAAIAGFTSGLASDLGPRGITVNAIAPSLLRTPGTNAQEPDELFARIVSMQSLPREETPADVANAAVFLASEEASFITGQVLVVDGGLTRR